LGYFIFVIMHQHAVHAAHNIVLPILSVCVSNADTVSNQMDI